SETYAREIQTPEYGSGLHRVFRQSRHQFYGVLNGVDEDVWDSRKDAFIARTYEPTDSRGKEANKRALQQELGLQRLKVPLLGFIARLVAQKGVDLLLGALPEILARKLQLVILGTGKRKFEEGLKSWIGRNPNLSVNLRYDEGLAHRIYAGADLFLMPSKFEPCGLGQMISMRYGTIPIVRRTGGLADTVFDYSQGLERATGFSFDVYSPRSLLEALDRALHVYGNRNEWNRLKENISRQDFSWDRSARTYVDVYSSIALKRSPRPP
ncbi:MAG: glycogen synthase, partial [Thermoplasmata archaeon]